MTTLIGRDAAPRRYPFSANGTVFISSLGRRPRTSRNSKPSALKARFIPAAICVELKANRSVESRFQRWPIIGSESWGDAPGWHENAPSALNHHVPLPSADRNLSGFLHRTAQRAVATIVS
jgi:hypothetical protein